MLENNYGVMADSTLAKRLGRTVVAIRLKANRLKLHRTGNFLTASDVARIMGLWPSTAVYWIRKGKIQAKKSKVVGVGQHACWHIEWDDFERFLKEHAGHYDITRIDPNEYTYFRRLAEKYVPKKHVPKVCRRWQPVEDAFLLHNHASMTYEALTQHLRRTREAIHYRLEILRSRGHVIPYKFPWTQRKVNGLHEENVA